RLHVQSGSPRRCAVFVRLALGPGPLLAPAARAVAGGTVGAGPAVLGDRPPLWDQEVHRLAVRPAGGTVRGQIDPGGDAIEHATGARALVAHRHLLRDPVADQPDSGTGGWFRPAVHLASCGRRESGRLSA